MRDPTPAERQLAFMLEKVDIRPIKDLARKHFPLGSKFRMVVEAEPDLIARHEIVGKSMPWEALMRDELEGR